MIHSLLYLGVQGGGRLKGASLRIIITSVRGYFKAKFTDKF